MGAIKTSSFAPAKINLYLHVIGCRDDGFHELDSLVVFADVGDRVQVELAEDTTFDIVGPFASEFERFEGNSVLRAFKALSTHTEYSSNVALKLEKNLPIASGIGGGSTDAGATINALLELWDVHVDKRELFDVAFSLGADVPVCVFGKPAYMSGAGEILEPIDNFPALPAILVNPNICLPTLAVFDHFALGKSRPGRISRMPNDVEGLISILKDRRNDLFDAAVDIVPEIGEVLSALKATSGCLLARMSGSGATCFGIYASEVDARIAASVIYELQPNWWVEPTILQGIAKQSSFKI